MTPSSDKVTKLLQEWSAGDNRALEKLIPLVDDELQRIADAYLRRERPGHELEAAALVNEAYLRLIQEPRKWESHKHFFAIAAKVMRHILVDYARRNLAAKRGGGAEHVSLMNAAALPSAITETENRFELLALDEALHRLAKIDERRSKVVELRYFGGLTFEEIADALDTSQATVEREWGYARLWLRRHLALQQDAKLDVSGFKGRSIVLVPNQVVEPFLLSLPSVLNDAQNSVRFSIQPRESRPEELAASKTIDVKRALFDAESLKEKFSIPENDLLISFISETLESPSRNLTNLLVAASSLSETPPRVAVISTSFIHRFILPIDPTYLLQCHAFYHLIVCCIAGAFLELPAHEDRGCLMDFNNNTLDITRKIQAGYALCDPCTHIVERHPLGDAFLKICGALKVWPSPTFSNNSSRQNQPRVFLCYSGADREKVLALHTRLLDDGFKPWMDKTNLIGGQDWEFEIRRAIKASDFFVACLSANFRHPTYGHKEIKLALEVLDTMPEGAIYLIPARLEPCAVGTRLADRQWIDLFKNDGYENLLKALRWKKRDEPI